LPKSWKSDAASFSILYTDFLPIPKKPPSEGALRQHILRASFQTKVWHASCLAKPPLPSPMEYGWRTVKDSLHPVYFEGNIAKDQNHVKTPIHIPLIFYLKRRMSSKNNCSVQMYVFSQEGDI
jgi:hypothetical protein